MSTTKVSDSDNNNMVENGLNSKVTELINSLNLLSVQKITKADIEFDIYQTEKFYEGWNTFSDKQKVKILWNNLDRDISKELFETKIELESIYYEKFKEYLIKKFGKPAISLTDYFSRKQQSNQHIEEYAKEVEKDGLKLKLTSKVRMEVLKLGITRFQKSMLQILNGERRINESLIEKLKGQESLEIRFKEEYKKRHLLKGLRTNPIQTPPKEKNYLCFSCGKPGHIAKYCRSGKTFEKVQNINEELEATNKAPSIYISSLKINPVFDTGAIDNYITKPLAYKLGIKILNLKNPIKKFTCLGQPFYVKEYIITDFIHNDIKWKEVFNILPGRLDHTILLGKNWIQKLTKKNLNRENNDILNELKKKLFIRSVNGIKLKYECPIDCQEKNRITDGAAFIPQAIEAKLNETIDQLLDLGYIRISNSSWCNRIRPVEKEDGTIRLTTNLIRLNQQVPLDRYSLPRIEEIIHNLNGYKYFSKIDIKDGFFQVPLKENDMHKTAFRIKNKLYEWTRMPQGFKNSPAVFQRLMDMVLKDVIGKGCYVYVDDILIVGKTEYEHDKLLKIVLEKLVEAGLQGNEKKCVFKQKEVEFLGYKLSEDSIKPLKEASETIEQYMKPRNIEEIRRFLGLVNYYRKFIPNCAELAEPISKLLRKDVAFEWGKEQEKAFINIKEALNSKAVLIQPNFNNDFILETDASNSGIGAILAQELNNEIRPIAFASRSLTQTERNYSITEKEMLAAIWAMEHFKYYLYGREFMLKTDHKALEAFNSKGFLESARIQRWMDRIQQFNFKVEYQKGESIAHVDALSRQFMDQAVNEIGENKKTIIIQTHNSLIHRGAKAVHQSLLKNGYTDITENDVKGVIKACEKCKMYNPIRSRAHRVIEAYYPGEKVGFDIIELNKGTNILVAIDYFTRKAFASYCKTKGTNKILKFMQKVHEELQIKLLIADEAKENISNSIKNWLSSQNIKQHITTPYHHQSNGRVERLNRTIRESLNKLEMKGSLHMRLSKVIETYNQTYHRSIGMPPNEAMNPDRNEEVKINQYNARVSENKKFLSNGKWPKLKINEEVLVEDHLRKSKRGPRFKTRAIVKEALDFNTYKLEKSNGKIYKRHISQLKALN